ncbi:hypothetical protein [Ensifer sp. ENS12]|uniref:hypothetical protein n=1 Tax=Ensifer sp. ENS12 TaxID=2854774 RepID=UPI001C48CCEF|nr:hypothetical protein [Ensifer sp. ENS12]MBV7522116.1 hypothetical protein [Ensifer sp. ENS12]
MITREQLFELVWSEPVSTVAGRFGVSGSYLARVCAALGVPRPPRGYWAQKAVGRAPPAPRLPEARRGSPRLWSQAEGPVLKRFYSPQPSRIRRGSQKGGLDRLIAAAKHSFRTARPDDRTAYLKPRKRLLVDVVASSAAIDRCLSFASRLFISLEAHGHTVTLARQGLTRITIDRRQSPTSDAPRRLDDWRPLRPTVAYFGLVPIGLAIVETSDTVLMHYVGRGRYVREADYVPPPETAVRYTLTRYRDAPSGRLKLIAYSPLGIPWQREWLDRSDAPLDGRIGQIVADLENAAISLGSSMQEAT